ncbi:MAG: hypothetical protein ABIH34_01950 [Nanoarchaeota archaeon]
MAKLPWRKFIFLLVQLFLILKLYAWWQSTTGLGLGLYLVVIFILFWIGNSLLGRLELGPTIPHTLIFRLSPKFSFTDNWFGFLVVICIALGFFLSRALVGSAFLTWFIVLLGIVLVWKLFGKGSDENRLRCLLGVAFIFGIGIGGRYTSNAAIVVFFIIASIMLYFLAPPGS